MRTKEQCAAIYGTRQGTVQATTYPSVLDCREDVRRRLASDGDLEWVTIKNHRILETLHAGRH